MLTANDLDIKITFTYLLATIIVLIIFGRKIFFAVFDEIGFKVAGYNLKTIDFIILFLITVTVVVAMPAVGSILSIALIVGIRLGAVKITKSFGLL